MAASRILLRGLRGRASSCSLRFLSSSAGSGSSSSHSRPATDAAAAVDADDKSPSLLVDRSGLYNAPGLPIRGFLLHLMFREGLGFKVL